MSSSIVVDVFRERFAASVERVVVFFRLFWNKEKNKENTTTAASLSSAFTARSTDDDAQRDVNVRHRTQKSEQIKP